MCFTAEFCGYTTRPTYSPQPINACLKHQIRAKPYCCTVPEHFKPALTYGAYRVLLTYQHAYGCHVYVRSASRHHGTDTQNRLSMLH